MTAKLKVTQHGEERMSARNFSLEEAEKAIVSFPSFFFILPLPTNNHTISNRISERRTAIINMDSD